MRTASVSRTWERRASSDDRTVAFVLLSLPKVSYPNTFAPELDSQTHVSPPEAGSGAPDVMRRWFSCAKSRPRPLCAGVTILLGGLIRSLVGRETPTPGREIAAAVNHSELGLSRVPSPLTGVHLRFPKGVGVGSPAEPPETSTLSLIGTAGSRLVSSATWFADGASRRRVH